MNKLTETVPKRIWLHEKQWLMTGHSEIAWSDKPGSGVAYVHADLLEAANARIAELEEELAQYRDAKNWTRPFDIDGRLMNEHALYLPKVMK